MKYHICAKCYHKNKNSLEILGTNTTDMCDSCEIRRSIFVVRFKREGVIVEGKVRQMSG